MDRFDSEEKDFFEEMMEKSLFRSMAKENEEEEDGSSLDADEQEDGLEELKLSLKEEGIDPSEAIEVLIQLGMISPNDMDCLENYIKVTEEFDQNTLLMEEE